MSKKKLSKVIILGDSAYYITNLELEKPPCLMPLSTLNSHSPTRPQLGLILWKNKLVLMEK